MLKEQTIQDAVKKFLTIDDLDDLVNYHNFLVKKYDIKKIQQCIEKLDVEITEQGLSNMLFHPNLLPVRVRSVLLRLALNLEFGEYVYLAAISLLRKQGLSEKEIRYFVLLMGRFLHIMVTEKWTDQVALTIANRTLVALLRIKNKPRIEDFHHALLPILKNPSYQRLFHNATLALLNYMPYTFKKENLRRELENTVGHNMYNQIFTIWKIMQKKDKDRTPEETLKITYHLAPIPNMKDLVPKGQAEKLKNIKWSDFGQAEKLIDDKPKNSINTFVFQLTTILGCGITALLITIWIFNSMHLQEIIFTKIPGLIGVLALLGAFGLIFSIIFYPLLRIFLAIIKKFVR